jgi:N4-gp56 family major capsid protein
MATFVKANAGNTNTLFHKTLLRAFSLNPVYRQFALSPTVKGVDSITFYRVNDLDSTVHPTLVDGVNPSSLDADVDTVKITLAQYGAYLEYAASVADIQPVDLIGSFTKKIGKLGADVLEQIIQDELLTAANINFASSAANRGAVGAALTADDIYAVYTDLEVGGAELITDIVPASDKTATIPVDACYILVVTPYQAHTVKKLTGFEPRYKYANPNAAFVGEIGSIGGMRIISNHILNGGIVPGSATVGSATITGLRSTASHCDVHRAIAFGKEAFGAGIGANGIKSIVKSPAEIGGALEMTGTTGYKADFACEILNQDYVAIIESAAVLA